MAHTKRKGKMGWVGGRGGLGAKNKKKVANNKNMFPCIFRFRFFCYNKLKHIFTLLSGFCHFSLFFPFSQHATHPPPPFVFVGHANFPCEFTLTCVKVIVSNFALSIGVRYEYQSSPTMFSKQKKKKPAKTNPFPIPNNWAQGKRGQQKVMEYFDKIVF